MGTWDVEPFGNDDAADFATDLDEASTPERIEMIGSVLDRVAHATDNDLRLEDTARHSDAIRAVAAAALVAAQCPGGAPVTSGYGPTTPMPEFPADLRRLALNALDSVIAPPSWLAEYWDESAEGPAWRRTIADLRKVLDPPQRESLFDL
jgi:hypothetical protein